MKYATDTLADARDPKTGAIRWGKLLLDKRVYIPILVLLAAAAVWAALPSSANELIPTYEVKREKFLVTLTESGEIRAVNAANVSAPRVRRISLKIVYLAPEGDYVQPGDTVCRFDLAEATIELREEESELEVKMSEKRRALADHKSTMTRMTADLKSAELSFELSKLNLEQMKYEAESKQKEAQLTHQRNEMELEKARQSVESQRIIQRSEMEKINLEIDQNRGDVERARRDLESMTLTAPREGLVVYGGNWSTGRKMAVGDEVWGGMPIVQLPDLSAMESETYVDEVDVGRVSAGLRAVVTLDAFQDSSFEGVVKSVARLGKDKEGSSALKVFETIISVTEQSDVLKPGMSTRNKIILNEIDDVLFVPQEAVFEKFGKRYVYVGDNGAFEEREVTLGEKSEDFVVIREGLEEGERVALRDPTIEINPETDGATNGAEFPS
jgi:HlyD family secretion protein